MAQEANRMSPVDFRESLKRQFGFLARSCHSFDAGYHDEAIRIAQCIRVLMHDTGKQRSLLTHLNAKSVSLMSTCLDIASKMRPGSRVQMFNGMGMFRSSPEGASYFPKLDDSMFQHDLPVEQWWAETVFILDPETWVSRKRVVLDAADKDGGAHVDAALTPIYERLVDSGDLGCFFDEQGTEIRVTGHHYVALRQMGHELLNSPSLVALVS
jgi:hypothetical protein